MFEENQLKKALKELEFLGNEGSRILEICSNKKIIKESEKVSIFDLNKALNVMLPYKMLANVPKLTQSNLDSLQALQKRCCDLNEKIDNVIHRAAMPRIKRCRTKRVAFLEVDELLLEAAAFPVELFGIPDLKSIVKVSQTWHKEVCEVCADGAPVVSLNKLETLISEGETLPVEYVDELESLRERRAHAKQWLEKFRKSIVTSGRNTRKTIEQTSTSTSGTVGEKMGFADMKKMVEQGEQLYEERRSKELTKALDMVDAAEEVMYTPCRYLLRWYSLTVWKYITITIIYYTVDHTCEGVHGGW